MMKRDIDVIVIKGEFTRCIGDDNPKDNDIIVQEYTGSMLWLHENGLLNIQKENEPFNLTDYVENYVNDASHKGISHMIVNYVTLPKIYDVLNPVEILRTWNKEVDPATFINIPFRKHSVTINVSTDDIRRKINNLKGINIKAYSYMEIYVYYKEN